MNLTQTHTIDHVASIIGPGGEFGTAPQDVGHSTYRASFRPGQLGAMPRFEGPAIGMYPVEEGAPKSTHGRIVEDIVDPVFRTAESHYKRVHGQEGDLQREVVQALRSRQRTRAEHEQKWRQWQTRQKRRQNGAVTEAGGSEATSVSVMPAGTRRAKGMNHCSDGPMRLALFNEDLPRPIWTTLASTPWAMQMPEDEGKGFHAAGP